MMKQRMLVTVQFKTKFLKRRILNEQTDIVDTVAKAVENEKSLLLIH